MPLPHTRRTRWPCCLSHRSARSALVAPKIRRPSMATSAKSHGFADSRAAVSRASHCRWVNPQGHGKVAFMQPEAALACAAGRGGGDGWRCYVVVAVQAQETDGQAPQRGHHRGAFPVRGRRPGFRRSSVLISAECRSRPMSSMLSAPAAIPATRHGTFRCALTPHSLPGRTSSAASWPRSGALRQGHHRDQPGVRHEIRVIERCARACEAMQQSHLQGVLSNRVLEASDTPHSPRSEGTFHADTPVITTI